MSNKIKKILSSCMFMCLLYVSIFCIGLTNGKGFKFVIPLKYITRVLSPKKISN